MNAWTTPVWMEAPVRTWWEASSAHVPQDLLGRDVKAVSAILVLGWHCVFQHSVYSETKFLPQGLLEYIGFTVFIVFIYTLHNYKQWSDSQF